LQLFNVASAPR